MKRKIFISGLVVVVIWLGVIRWSNRNKDWSEEIAEINPTPTTTPLPTKAPEDDWQIYKNATIGFEIKHPANLIIDDSDGQSVQMVLVGPTQQSQTEFFDGIALSVRKIKVDKDLTKQRIEEEMANYKEVNGIEATGDLMDININGNKGFRYGEGNSWFNYIPTEDGYLEIANLSADPGNLSFIQTAEKIINSLVILE